MPVSEQLSDVGVAGLCPAGCALVLRLTGAGLRVSLWDAAAESLEAFVTLNAATRGGLVGYASSEDFFESLNTPRRMVVFETEPGPLAASLRPSLREPDRLLELPWREEPMAPGELDLLELTLVSQLD